MRDGYDQLEGWAEAWIERINGLFHRNKQRLAVRSEEAAFGREDQGLRDAVVQMAQVRDEELAQSTLHTVQRKALESLQRHWAGATIFVDHPDIPMDNNEAERCLRTPVVGRKNYYGSGSVWSGLFTAMVFSLLQTYLRNGLDPQQVLLAYFEACAQQGGEPPDHLEAFLPWNLSEEQQRSWAFPQHPP